MSGSESGMVVDRPIVIVGAGPTGLVVAIELARRGIAFHLVDRQPKPASYSAAIFIKSRTMEILSALGVIDEFLELGEIVNGVNLFLEEDQVGSYRFEHLDTPYPFVLSIPENETTRILTHRLGQLSGSVERGVEFVGIEESEEKVHVHLNSQDAGEYWVEADWVVGTDGYHSAVREAIGDQFDGHDYPELWGVVDTHITNWNHARDITCGQLRPPNVIPFPLGKDRWRVYFRPEKADDEAVAKASERLALFSPGAEMQNPDEPQFFRSHSRVARKYRIGRIFLAGDAAHASNPIQGHGMNAGMHDAYNLGWKLAQAVGGGSHDLLIDSYERERRPVDQSIVRSGDEAYVRMDPKHKAELEEAIAHLATPEGQALAALAESEIALSYGDSPIVEEIGPVPEPTPLRTATGARVGDVDDLVCLDQRVRLHDLISGPTPCALVLLGEAEPSAISQAQSLLETIVGRTNPVLVAAYVVVRGEAEDQPTESNVLIDTTGRLHERLCVHGPALCLIRPDGHLGFRCSPPSVERLSAHLDRLYGQD